MVYIFRHRSALIFADLPLVSCKASGHRIAGGLPSAQFLFLLYVAAVGFESRPPDHQADALLPDQAAPQHRDGDPNCGINVENCNADMPPVLVAY